MTHQLSAPVTRRTLLRRLAALALALPVVGAIGAACSDEPDGVEGAAAAAAGTGQPASGVAAG